MVAHTHPYVIGVDTHARSHAFAILAMPHGEVVEERQFPTTAAGITRAVQWVSRRTGGDLGALWVVECAATYGAQLARHVTAAGYQVVEAARMSAKDNRGVGKSDPLDARRIAASVLALEADQQRYLRQNDGARAGLRVLLAARDHMTSERTGTINALIALLRILDLGIDARKPLTAAQVLEVSKWRSRTESVDMAIARAEAVRLAKRVMDLDAELAQNSRTTTALLQQSPARVLLGQARYRPGHRCRCLRRVVSPGTVAFRGRVRLTRRRQPYPCLLGKHGASSSQPRRRQEVEQGPAHGRHRAYDPRPSDQGLRCTPAGRRAHQTRDPPNPQALSRPTDPPSVDGRKPSRPFDAQLDSRRVVPHLTDIEGSLPSPALI